MGRRRHYRNRLDTGTEKFYCPKCGHKKLVQDNAYCTAHRSYFKTWTCLHNAPPKRWGSKKPSGPQCDCEIKAEGRDAEISDYSDILGKLAQINVPQVVNWLLENERDIYKKGLEVLHTSDLMDVVRRRAGSDDVGVAIYWRAAGYDSDDTELFNPMSSFNNSLRSEAAQFVKFRGTPLQRIFQYNGYCPWTKDSLSTPFAGNLGKKLKKQIVEWAIDLEQQLPALTKEARREDRRWESEKSALTEAIRPLGCHGYNGETRTLSIGYITLSPAESVGVADVMAPRDVPLRVLAVGNRTVTPEQFIAIEKIMKQSLQVAVDLGPITVAEAKKIHAILHPERVSASV